MENPKISKEEVIGNNSLELEPGFCSDSTPVLHSVTLVVTAKYGEEFETRVELTRDGVIELVTKLVRLL